MSAFEADRFNHSRTSPGAKLVANGAAIGRSPRAVAGKTTATAPHSAPPKLPTVPQSGDSEPSGSEPVSRSHQRPSLGPWRHKRRDRFAREPKLQHTLRTAQL